MRFGRTLGQRCHVLAHLMLRRQQAALLPDDLPGPITSSIVRPAGGTPSARETASLIRLLDDARYRQDQLRRLRQAVEEALASRHPQAAIAIARVCLQPPRPGARRGAHDPDSVGAVADALGVDDSTVRRWLREGWELVGILWAPAGELDWALDHRPKGDLPISDEDLAWALEVRERLWHP